MDALVAAHVVGEPGEAEVDAPAARVPHRVVHRRVLRDVVELDPPRRPDPVEHDDDRRIGHRRLERGEPEERADRDADEHHDDGRGQRRGRCGQQRPHHDRDRDGDRKPEP